MHCAPKQTAPRITLCLLCAALLLLPALTGLAVSEGRVTGGNLHLRAAPSEDAKILGTYETGTKVTILGTEGDWYQVSLANGDAGYMKSRYVLVSAQGRVDNNGNDVNLRAGPSESSKVLGQFTSGTTLTVISSDAHDMWSYVSIEGMEGYLLTRFIGAVPADDTPAVTDAADAESSSNPFLLDTDGDNAVVHQVGTSESKVSFDTAFYYTITYPHLDIETADAALEDWVAEIIEEGEALEAESPEGEALELTVQYDAYLVADRYIGVLETGFLNSTTFAHPTDFLFALNVDRETGALLSPEQIWAEGQTENVLTLLAEELVKIQPDPFDGETMMDASWLKYSLITPDGIAILLPRGEYLASVYGTVEVALPYAQLEAGGMLALPLGDYTPTAEPAEAGSGPLPTPPAQAEIDPSRPMVALTFDDGPSDYTSAILDVLADHGARATFCVIGNRVDSYQDVLRRIVAQGNEVATHTWSHKNLTKLSPDGIHTQLAESMQAITAITGQPVTVLRPPYGAVNRDVQSICRRLDLTIVTWSLDTEDWKTESADRTYDAIMRHVKNGSIILCHDSHLSTANAMQRVVPELLEKGYQLVTVSELLSFSVTHGEPGKIYNHLDTSHLPTTK